MIISKKTFLVTLAIIMISASVQAATSTSVTVKTDVPYYDIAIRLINYASEDVMGSVYLKTDSTGYAEGNFSSEESRVKITVLIYRDGVIYKQFDNYGTYNTGGTISLDFRENNNNTSNNTNNGTNNSSNNSTGGNGDNNSSNNQSDSSSSTTGNVISESSRQSNVSSNLASSLWMYIAAGIILVGAAGFLGVRYVQQKGTMSGMARYDKARGPIEDKPLFPQENFQPVSGKMDDLAAQQELRKAKDRIRNLERELTMARNAEKIKEAERKIEEDKKRLDRLRRGESV